ncbi:hypothetical protein [Aquimarina macrocephali]|uniref:hypothetical protein n=1 Tax=Aquimarina macrocephali TaxID=666563 RepID=UPI003F67954D
MATTILNVDFEITNFEGILLEIENTSFHQSSKGCNYIRVEVLTNVLANVVTNPISINPNTQNPFSFDYLRGVGIQIKCKTNDGQEATRNIETPSVLSNENVKVKVNQSPEGATVTVIVNPSKGLVLQYSLDNSTWQSSNIFNGQPPGNYTMYIKDQFGCNTSKPFFVDEFGIQDPFLLVSKSNSIRYAERIQWGVCSNYKTDENTLSCESQVPLPYTEIQQFQNCDSPITQIKSNYNEIIATVIKENKEEVSLPVQKKTNNTRLKDQRDARMYNLGDEKTGVYFVSGNIYNYDTGIDTGDNYSLNGALPSWGVVGNYIKIENSWYDIEEVLFDESRSAEVIVIDKIYSGVDTVIKISSIYNNFNYEVYEFNVNMVEFLNQNIRIRINNNHDAYENKEHLSEVINVKVEQKNTIEIRYKNKTNTDIFYATGIENIIRIPINTINGKASDESETYKTDTTAILISSEIHELDEFVFEPVTKEMMRKLVQALSHSDILMNGVSYVKSDNVEVEGPLEETNLYIVKANMIKANNAFSNQIGVETNTSSTTIEVPKLLESENGHIAIGN